MNSDVFAGDWSVFWPAGRAANPYSDIEALPFAYPPSLLLLLKPIAQLPFFASLILWSAAGTAALWLAASKLTGRMAASLALLPLAWLVNIISGQTGLFVGALTISGLLARRPWLAGLCFAAAGAIKPQSLIALPIALLASREWRTMFWTVGWGLALILASAGLFGAHLWLDWFHVLPHFREVLAASGLDRLGVGVNGLVIRFGLSPVIYWFGVALGIACAWFVFKRDNKADRYAALICAAVLISPYTLHYDLAGLGAVAIALLANKDRPLWMGAALTISFVLAPIGIVFLAAGMIVEHWCRPRIMNYGDTAHTSLK